MLVMLNDVEIKTREQAIEKILQIRSAKVMKGNGKVRILKGPELNFEAASYKELILIDSINDEPPLTNKMSEDQLLQLKAEPMKTAYKCTTVSSERLVKLMTSCATRVVNPEEQDGMIMNVISARKKNPGRVVGNKYKF